MAQRPGNAEYERERDDGYRAIGRYVVAFSELAYEMRRLIAMRVGGNDTWPLANIALGEVQAMQLCHAFFGLCREATDYTPVETKVASALSKEVEAAITTRNDVAHGDWHVGYLRMDHGSATVETAPPRLVRLLPHRKEGAYKSVDLEVQDIDAMTDRLLALLTMVVEFGKLAFDSPLLRTDDRKVSVGEFRIEDIYIVKGGGKGRHNEPAEVVRKGPCAHLVSCLDFV